MGLTMLTERGYSYTTNAQREIERGVKGKLCYITLDFDIEMLPLKVRTRGNIITVGSERFRGPQSFSSQVLSKRKQAESMTQIGGSILSSLSTSQQMGITLSMVQPLSTGSAFEESKFLNK